MKEREDDGQVVMIGASFDEIAAEASKAVKAEIDKQVEAITPQIAKALQEGAAALFDANAALEAARRSIRRLRLALFVLAVVCGTEAGFIAKVILHPR